MEDTDACPNCEFPRPHHAVGCPVGAARRVIIHSRAVTVKSTDTRYITRVTIEFTYPALSADHGRRRDPGRRGI